MHKADKVEQVVTRVPSSCLTEYTCVQSTFGKQLQQCSQAEPSASGLLASAEQTREAVLKSEIPTIHMILCCVAGRSPFQAFPPARGLMSPSPYSHG